MNKKIVQNLIIKGYEMETKGIHIFTSLFVLTFCYIGGNYILQQCINSPSASRLIIKDGYEEERLGSYILRKWLNKFDDD